MLIQLIVISVLLLALALAGIGIKILATKDGEFKKTCGSVNPKTGKPIGCVCGDGDGGDSCENVEPIRVES
jgi:hypothetical protein